MKKSSVLMVHNYYRSANPSGENRSFEDEFRLLELNGHTMSKYCRESDEIDGYRFRQKLSLPLRTVWAKDSLADLREVIAESPPDLVHFQNTFPLISPSAYYACKEVGLPVVQAVRNFRMKCVNAEFFRNGKVCEDCLRKTVGWPGVLHGCYRDSRIASAVIAAMNGLHELVGTWESAVDLFITASTLAKSKLVESGIPDSKIFVKPNFVDPDPGQGRHTGDFGLFVGRMSPEKGLITLLDAWAKVAGLGTRLVLVGDGPLMPRVKVLAAQLSSVQLEGRLSRTQVLILMKEAKFVVLPSEWYETFGRVAIEAFACGTPVVASNIGAPAEIVEHGVTGLLFEPGSVDELAAALEFLISGSSQSGEFGRNARQIYLAKYGAEENYRLMMEAYSSVL